MDRKLLDILVCPATRQSLSVLEKHGMQALNAAITAGQVNRSDDTPETVPLREALVTRDRKLVYRIDEGIPVLLADEAIPTSNVAGFTET
ncbi:MULTISPECIES: Trm112 family protein [unclassified Luteimonas]